MKGMEKRDGSLTLAFRKPLYPPPNDSTSLHICPLRNFAASGPDTSRMFLFSLAAAGLLTPTASETPGVAGPWAWTVYALVAALRSGCCMPGRNSLGIISCGER